MTEKVISLNQHKIDEANKLIDEAEANAKEEFEHVTDELLELHTEYSDVSKADMLKAVWNMAKRMDEIETEFLRFKIQIVELIKPIVEGG